MQSMVEKRNELYAKTVIQGLESRNMHGYYAADKAEALRLALALIPAGSTVARGGSRSAEEIGLVEAVRQGDYRYIDKEQFADRQEAEREAHFAQVFLSGTNALTEDGILVNIDGNANRVSALAAGPAKVIIIAGMNKICKDVDAAMKRARNVAAPVNAQRFALQTPCKVTGSCMNCKCPDTICCQFLITRYSRQKDRIHVILVNDTLGF